MAGYTCSGCGRVFGGVTGFDLHRRGEFLQIGQVGKGRFCADPLSAGMRLNDKGQWCLPAPVESFLKESA